MIRIVTGKGGVGRSVIALAMARHYASLGKRTLLCEHTAADSAVRMLGAAPTDGEVRPISNNLFAVRLTTEDAVREYAMVVLKFRTLYNVVFGNRVVKYFLRAVPALGEFVTIGKIWFEETGKSGQRWDMIIVDAPATGHLISWLRVPQVFEEMIPSGPLHASAKDFREMLQDPKRTRLDIVTLPEEMPVNEALAIEEACAKYHLATRGLTIANKVLAATAPEVLAAAPGHPLFERLREQEHWRLLGEGYLAKLPSLVRVARRDLPISDAAGIDGIADELGLP